MKNIRNNISKKNIWNDNSRMNIWNNNNTKANGHFLISICSISKICSHICDCETHHTADCLLDIGLDVCILQQTCKLYFNVIPADGRKNSLENADDNFEFFLLHWNYIQKKLLYSAGAQNWHLADESAVAVEVEKVGICVCVLKLRCISILNLWFNLHFAFKLQTSSYATMEYFIL